MAQSRDKRRQRARRPSVPPTQASPVARQPTTRRRRLVIAFLVIVAVAGILAVTAPSGDDTGAPVAPGIAGEHSR